MARNLGALSLLGLVLAAAAYVATGRGDLPAGTMRLGYGSTSVTVDTASFLIGAALGGVATWVAKLPWGDIPRAILALLPRWRRGVVRLSLAAMCVGVLLFY